MKRLLNKNTIVLLDQAVFSGGSFLITIILARFVLNPFDFGIFSSLTLFNYALISLLNSVIVQPFQVSLEKVKDKNNYVSFSFWSQLILVVLVVLGLLLISNANFDFLSTVKHLTMNALLFFVGFIMHDYARKIFLAQSFVTTSFIIDFVTTSLHLGVLFYSWYFEISSLNTLVFLLGLAYVPSFIISIFVIKPFNSKIREWKSFIQMHVEQGKWLLLTTLTQWWASNLFIVTSGVYLGAVSLGAFRLVQSLFGILNLVLQTFENFVLPEASRKYNVSPDSAKEYLRMISKKSGFLFFVVLLVLFVFSENVMELAGGAKYLSYAYIVKGMVILYVFIFLGYPIRLSIRLLILNKVFFVGYLFSFFFSVISFNYLLETWGIVGAIIGLITSQLIVLSYWQYVLYKNQFVLWK
jgi:O-antigen/teichoic acid export membrane protein